MANNGSKQVLVYDKQKDMYGWVDYNTLKILYPSRKLSDFQVGFFVTETVVVVPNSAFAGNKNTIRDFNNYLLLTAGDSYEKLAKRLENARTSYRELKSQFLGASKENDLLKSTIKDLEFELRKSEDIAFKRENLYNQDATNLNLRISKLEELLYFYVDELETQKSNKLSNKIKRSFEKVVKYLKSEDKELKE